MLLELCDELLYGYLLVVSLLFSGGQIELFLLYLAVSELQLSPFIF